MTRKLVIELNFYMVCGFAANQSVNLPEAGSINSPRLQTGVKAKCHI
jgi:hypothetical protein